ncbi:hypothetical protein SKAU_G00394730 [Synaphobranchus kaupii]|uniref:Uncharacterized protein n=1 Tax=Synaphobranchus kaupii TaxID=118154 RepID=A0A9Q1EC87_SYNKA|nr:hypothetical protein SKAU_G00394730 [Synaphobranchus kaupii]
MGAYRGLEGVDWISGVQPEGRWPYDGPTATTSSCVSGPSRPLSQSHTYPPEQPPDPPPPLFLYCYI